MFSMCWPPRVRPLFFALFALVVVPVTACRSSVPPHRHILIVVDGLRPDYVTPEVMPHLRALGARGVVFARHHAVYPTVTRVNASSFSTGSYPQVHGLMGNAVYFPNVDVSAFLDTGDRQVLERVAQVEGRLLTTSTIGEALQAADRRMLVVSSGSAGSAFLNNHTLAGGAILHHAFTLPDEWRQAMEVIGPPPAEDAARPEFDRYAVDALLRVGLPRVDPAVTVLWLGALDATAHAQGVGAPQTMDVLRRVDGEIARLQEGLREMNLLDDYNIWVTSDHGFSTHTGGAPIDAVLAPFVGTLADGSPRIVAQGGAIYVRDDDPVVVAGIVRGLQQTSGVGAIFTRAARADAFDGVVPGTLSFDAARWNHDRSAHILFSPDWTDATNPHGFSGTTASGGTAGHGSTSPWDVHNTLIAAGPDLLAGVTVQTPSGNVDFAPTFLHLLGIARPSSMQGRVLGDALVAPSAGSSPAVRSFEHQVSTPDGAYRLTASFSVVSSGGQEYRYLDGTRVERVP